MARHLLVDYQPYWETSVKPQNFEDFCDMIETQGRITAIWRMAQIDAKTGEIVKETWTPRTVTDNGAVNILASAIANASNANPWNNILITNNSGSSTLTSATGTSAITSLSVAAIPAAIPLDYPAPIGSTPTQLTIGYGSGTTQTITNNAAASQNATSLTVVSFTPSINYPIGTAVVPLPNVGENPSNANLTANATSALSQYSGVIAAGGFTYLNTTGQGNRSVTVVFVFKNATNGGSTSNGNYTDLWLVNVTSAASNATSGLFVGNYIDHAINTPQRCDNNNNISASIQVKI